MVDFEQGRKMVFVLELSWSIFCCYNKIPKAS